MATKSYHSRDRHTTARVPARGRHRPRTSRFTIRSSAPNEPPSSRSCTWESIYPPDNPRLRCTAEARRRGGRGRGRLSAAVLDECAGVYWLGIMVHPEWQRRGNRPGDARDAGAVRTPAGSDDPAHQPAEKTLPPRFVLGTGRIQKHRHPLRVGDDVQAFDEAPFLPVLEGAMQAGYKLTTLAEERPFTPDADAAALRPDLTTAAEVPFPGGAVHQERTFEIWRKGNLETPTIRPAAFFVASSGTSMLATTTLELPATPDEPAITHMTASCASTAGTAWRRHSS